MPIIKMTGRQIIYAKKKIRIYIKQVKLQVFFTLAISRYDWRSIYFIELLLILIVAEDEATERVGTIL